MSYTKIKELYDELFPADKIADKLQLEVRDVRQTIKLIKRIKYFNAIRNGDVLSVGSKTEAYFTEKEMLAGNPTYSFEGLSGQEKEIWKSL
jgi:hypothetical protein